MFMCTLAEIGWVVYNGHNQRVAAASIITGVAVITLSMWLLHTERKWGDFLLGGSNAKLYDPGMRSDMLDAARANSERQQQGAAPMVETELNQKETGGVVGGNEVTNRR